MGSKRMPERPNEKTYTVAIEMLWKVALVAFYQPKDQRLRTGVNKLQALFEACVCNGVPCLLFKFTKGLGGPAIVFIRSSLGGQVSQGCPSQTGLEETDHLWLDTAPLLLPSKTNFLKCLAFQLIVLILLLRNPFLEAKTVGTGQVSLESQVNSTVQLFRTGPMDLLQRLENRFKYLSNCEMCLPLSTLLGHLAQELKGLFFNMDPSTCCSGNSSAVAFLSLAKIRTLVFSAMLGHSLEPGDTVRTGEGSLVFL